MFVCKYEIGPVLKEYLVHKIKLKIIYKLADLGKHSTLVKKSREMLRVTIVIFLKLFH